MGNLLAEFTGVHSLRADIRNFFKHLILDIYTQLFSNCFLSMLQSLMGQEPVLVWHPQPLHLKIWLST